jgi:hypothetical protein
VVSLYGAMSVVAGARNHLQANRTVDFRFQIQAKDTLFARYWEVFGLNDPLRLMRREFSSAAAS